MALTASTTANTGATPVLFEPPLPSYFHGHGAVDCSLYFWSWPLQSNICVCYINASFLNDVDDTLCTTPSVRTVHGTG